MSVEEREGLRLLSIVAHPHDLCHMGGVGVPVRAGGAPAASVWRRGGVGCNQLDRGKEKR